MNSPAPATISFIEMIDKQVEVKILDIGAYPMGVPNYVNLMKAGMTKVVGFEPGEAAMAKLQAIKGPNETYLPYAVGDGKMHTLHMCLAADMSSLLAPNMHLLERFHGFPLWAQVVDKIPIQTHRLDDISETANADFLQIDIQGAALMALKHAAKRLKHISVIQVEVEFLQMYEGQPLFSEVEIFLRKKGFVLHRFTPLVSRVIKPMMSNNNEFAGLSQIFWTDAIFIKDFTKLEVVTDHQLLAMARILHDVYQSYDMVFYFLTEYDRRTQATTASSYFASLERSRALALAAG